MSWGPAIGMRGVGKIHAAAPGPVLPPAGQAFVVHSSIAIRVGWRIGGGRCRGRNNAGDHCPQDIRRHPLHSVIHTGMLVGSAGHFQREVHRSRIEDERTAGRCIDRAVRKRMIAERIDYRGVREGDEPGRRQAIIIHFIVLVANEADDIISILQPCAAVHPAVCIRDNPGERYPTTELGFCTLRPAAHSPADSQADHAS